MGITDKITTTESAVGNLSAFRVLKDSNLVKTGGGRSQAISEMWKYRGGFPFRIMSGKKTNLMFLTDIEWKVVHEIAIKEKVGQTGKYPITDFICSTSIVGVNPDGSLIKNDKQCIIEKALGREPKLIAVAKILNMTPWTTKDGVKIPWTVQTIIIPSNSPILQQLAAVTEVTKRDLKYSVFTVSRSEQEKSPKIGDSWTYKSHFTEDEVLSEEGLSAALEKVDLDKGFPILSDEDIVVLLKNHKRLCDRFSDGKNILFMYSEHEMAEILGQLPAKPVVTKVEETKSAIKQEILKTDGLEDLEDMQIGNILDETGNTY